MSIDLYTELQWLPRAPQDFSASVKAWSEVDGGARLRELASTALNLKQLTRLAKPIAAAIGRGADLAPLLPFR